ncbi:MAG: hypothetical protein ACREML_04235, partial [Vulcanimicrobiaceae bacterium]
YTVMSCLGFLSGSNCVHYSTPDRRLAYLDLVEKGEMPAGIACPDGVAVHYRGGKIFQAVSITPEIQAYAVEKVDGKVAESALPTTLLK